MYASWQWVSSTRSDDVDGKSRFASRVESRGVAWIYALLLAGAVAVLIAAEWPRLTSRLGTSPRLPGRRSRRRKPHLHLVPSESEEFAASVERDLDRLPTIDERDRR